MKVLHNKSKQSKITQHPKQWLHHNQSNDCTLINSKIAPQSKQILHHSQSNKNTIWLKLSYFTFMFTIAPPEFWIEEIRPVELEQISGVIITK